MKTILILLSVSSLAIASNDIDLVKSYLEKVNQYYYNNDKEISYDLSIRFFDNIKMNRSLDSITAHYSLYNNVIVGRYDKTGLFINAEYYVTIIDDTKKMFVSKNSVDGRPDQALKTFGELVKAGNAKIRLHSKTGDKLTISIIPKEQSIDSLQLRIDPVTGVIYYLNIYVGNTENEKASNEYPCIQYRFSNQRKRIPDDVVKERYRLSRYLNVTGNEISPSKLYSNYEVVNNIIQ